MTPALTSEQLRRVARDRSRARARMATRHARQMRGMTIGILLLAVAVTTWLAVWLTSLSSVLAIVATSVVALYFAGFGYVINEMLKADQEDAKRIAHAAKILRVHSRPGVAVKQTQPSEQPIVQSPSPAEVTIASDIDEKVDEVQVAAEHKAGQGVRKMTRAEIDARTAALAVPATPSYTLKSVAGNSAENLAQNVSDANVPFRPRRLHERIGDGLVGQAHSADQSANGADSRDDVLGGGSMLDALLSRRRA